MSQSSLWVMDKDFNGSEVTEYGNSWLFSPMVWDVLLDKYMRAEVQTPYGFKKSIITDFSGELHRKLNGIINNCDNFYDRIIWEMSNQQVFFSKDKELIENAIKEAIEKDSEFAKDDEEHIGTLKREHIKERWLEIAKDISEIDIEESPYFIFKNTSVDDGVECWFEKYSEESEEYESCSLKELEKIVAEFVEIKANGEIKFIDNIKFFSKESEEI